MNPICNACGEGHTTPETEVVDYIYEGITHHVTMFYNVCDTCGSTLSGKEEVDRGVKQIQEIKHKK